LLVLQQDPFRAAWVVAAGAAAVVAAAYTCTSTTECDSIKLDNMKLEDPVAWARDANKSPSGLKVFTGNANKALAQDIANHLGMSLGKISVSRFADGEVNVVINENVRGKDVYIIQPTSPPVNETLMELLLMISTMRRYVRHCTC
jgi:hypothetical protein